MKNRLGRVGVFWVLVTAIVALYADGFDYKFTMDKNDTYVKEPIIMKLDIEQTDHSKVMLFKFDIKASSEYEAYRLDMKESDAYHSAKIEYTYLIYPLKSADIDIKFDLLQMVTTDAKVAYSFSGDRDNTRGLTKTDIPISLPPLKIYAKPLPKDTAIVGDFKLTYKVKTKKAKAHEPLPITITIKGHGYPPLLNEILPKSDDYTIFTGQNQIKNVRNKNGTYSSITYPLALSATKSFDLKPMKIKAFDPKSNKTYYITTPKESFKIESVSMDKLVDKIDSPKNLHYDWSWVTTLIGYLVVFVAGFLSAKSIKWIPKNRYIPQIDNFTEEIESIDSPKELLTLLISTDSTKYSDTIEKLENTIYGKKKTSLSSIKREVIIKSKTL